MSRGTSNDVKRELALLFSGPAFIDALKTVIIEENEGNVPPLPAAILREETLAQVVFPLLELIAYRVTYPNQDVVKYAEIELGVRWTAVAHNEATVTRHIEALVAASVNMLWGLTLPNVNSGPILVREEDYSPLLPTPNHPFLKSAAVLITVPVWRD